MRVRADASALSDPDGRPLPIGMGMAAEVDLLGDKRSAPQYLLTSITRLRENVFRERYMLAVRYADASDGLAIEVQVAIRSQ